MSSTNTRAPSAQPKWLVRAVGLALALAAVLVYWPVRHHDFLRIDDPAYLVKNSHVNTGLRLENILWAFTHSHWFNWHPVTWLSHMLDCQCFGLNPGPHHLVNVAFHAINTLLLLGLLRWLTGAFWRSSLVAGLFALHPLHVESVAWVAERKDVLSMFFFLLTLWAYARYARASRTVPGRAQASRWSFYAVTLVLYVLGLMSKPMLVTLPFVLLLLDYWPLGRMAPLAGLPDAACVRPLLKSLIWEKLPFLALATASSVVTFLVQQKEGAIIEASLLPFENRLGNALLSYARYLGMTFVPTGLSVFYPLPREMPWAQVGGATLLLLAVTVLALRFARSKPYLLFGWLWYLGTLVPVIGLVKAGEQALADRYTYIPLVGIFIALVWALAELAQRYAFLRKPLWAAGGASLVACALATHQQLRYWQNSYALYEHANAVTENNYMAQLVIGQLLWEEGKLPEAKRWLLQALSLAPHSPDAHTGLGFLLLREDRYAEAVEHFQQAVAGAPNLEQAHYGLAYCHFRQGDLQNAEASCRRAYELEPDNGNVVLLQALISRSQGKSAEAEALCRHVLQIKPGWAPALRQLADWLAADGKSEESEKLYLEAVAAEPNNTDGHNGLAAVLERAGKLEAAMAQLSQSLTLEPNQPMERCHLGGLLSQLHRTADSIEQYRQALQLKPDLAAALNNLAWILATGSESRFRDGAEAVRLAEQACQQAGDNTPFFIGTLAAAYAEAGRFEEAIKTAEKARDLARKAGQEEIAKRNEQMLALYRARQAFHE